MTTTSEPGTPIEAQNGPIVARAGTYFRNTRYFICLMLLGWGGWFLYDGFIGWPKQNRQIDDLESRATIAERAGRNTEAADLRTQAKKIGSKHKESDLTLQKILGFALPPLGIYTLMNALRKSRGEIRLDGQKLSAPGHPPVPFDAITALDKRLWDKKGIAYIDYELPDGGAKGTITLDDFVYERKPVDAIYERVERFIAPVAAPAESELPDVAS